MKNTGVVIICFLLLVGASSCGSQPAEPVSEPGHSVAASVASPPQGEAADHAEDAAGGMEEVEADGADETAGDAGKGLEAGEPDATAPATWQEAYAGYLVSKDYVDYFYLGDINGNGVPELIISRGDETNSGEVLCFIDGSLEVLGLGVVSVWGRVGYLERTNQIIFLQWYGHTYGTFGSVDFYLYDWTPGGYAETRALHRESGNGWTEEYGQGLVNGEPVAFDEFETALAEMYALLEASTWFPMTDAGEVGDYLEYFTQWEPW